MNATHAPAARGVARAVTELELFAGYAHEPVRDPYEVALLERISELWRWRSWYRSRAYTIDWPIRWQNEHELRSLVRLARSARKAAAAPMVATCLRCGKPGIRDVHFGLCCACSEAVWERLAPLPTGAQVGCPDHDPNSGPGSDQCLSCREYAPDPIDQYRATVPV